MSTDNTELDTLSSTIKKGIRNALKDVHTAMPGIVESFNAEKMTASVQPAVQRLFKKDDGETVTTRPENLPLLINVPVVFPRGGGYSMTFPVAKGDECLVVFCERSYDIWHQNSGIQGPGALRFHSLSDAVCHVGLSSAPKAVPDFLTDGVRIGKDDGTSKIDITSGNILFETSTKVTLTSTDVEVNGNLQVNGTATATGLITGDAGLDITGDTNLDDVVNSGSTGIGSAHGHLGVTVGTGTSGLPAPGIP